MTIQPSSRNADGINSECQAKSMCLQIEALLLATVTLQLSSTLAKSKMLINHHRSDIDFILNATT